MKQFKCEISINGKRSVVTVSANNSIDAKRFVEAQYPNCKITFWNVKAL